jgi:hypothetical protein
MPPAEQALEMPSFWAPADTACSLIDGHQQNATKLSVDQLQRPLHLSTFGYNPFLF